MKTKLKFCAMAVTLLALLSVMTGGAWAGTIVDGSLVLDKTSIAAGQKVNLSVLGLNSEGIVDTASTTEYFAYIKSLTGTVSPTGSKTSPSTDGKFSALTNSEGWVQLVNGIAKAYVEYASTAGNDSLSVILQRKSSDGLYTTIKSFTQAITVTPASANTGSLSIYKYFNTTSGSASGLTVGINPSETDKNKVFVAAKTKGSSPVTDTGASGTVTVTLRPTTTSDSAGNVSETSYSFTGTMTQGLATVTVDVSTIQKAGLYYVEATFGGLSSVPKNNKAAGQTVTIDPGSYAKYQITPFTGTIGTVGSGGPQFGKGNGTTVRVSLLDSYDNYTFASSQLVPTIAASGYVDLNTTDSTSTPGTIDKGSAYVDISVSANKSGDKGTASITVTDSNGKSGTAAEILVKNQWYSAPAPGTSFTAAQANTFLNGLVYATSTGTTGSVAADTAGVTLTFIDKSKSKLKTVSATATIKTASGNNSIEFIPEKSIDATYAVISKSDWGSFTTDTALNIFGGTPNTLVLVDSHNQALTSLPVTPNATGTTYTTSIYHDRLIVKDAKGNSATYRVSGATAATTTFTVSSDKVSSFAVESDLSTGSKTLTYNTSSFTGTDSTLAIKMKDAAFTSVKVNPTVTIPSSTLKTINAYITTTDIPANGSVPIRVETLDSDGSKIGSNIVVDWTTTLTGASMQIIDTAGTVTAVGKGSVQTIISAGTTFVFNAGSKTGTFALTFKNSAGDIKSELTFNVTSISTSGKTVGSDPGTQEVTVGEDEVLNLVVNTTNTNNDTPKYAWFMFLAIYDGVQTPLYLLSDNGIIVELTDDLNVLAYTYTYPTSSPAFIAQLTMSDLDLTVGDIFAYAYAYMNQVNEIVIDNVVFITVE